MAYRKDKGEYKHFCDVVNCGKEIPSRNMLILDWVIDFKHNSKHLCPEHRKQVNGFVAGLK